MFVFWNSAMNCAYYTSWKCGDLRVLEGILIISGNVFLGYSNRVFFLLCGHCIVSLHCVVCAADFWLVSVVDFCWGSDEGCFVPLWSLALKCWEAEQEESLRSGDREGLSMWYISVKPQIAISLGLHSLLSLCLPLSCCSLPLFWLCAPSISGDKEDVNKTQKTSIAKYPLPAGWDIVEWKCLTSWAREQCVFFIISRKLPWPHPTLFGTTGSFLPCLVYKCLWSLLSSAYGHHLPVKCAIRGLW